MKRISFMLLLLLVLIGLPVEVTLAQDLVKSPFIVQAGSLIQEGFHPQPGYVIGTDIPTGAILVIGKVVQKVEVTGIYVKREWAGASELVGTRAFTVDQFGLTPVGKGALYLGYGAGWWHSFDPNGDDWDKLAYRIEFGLKLPIAGRVFEFYLGGDLVMKEMFTVEPLAYYPHFSFSLF